MKRNAMKASPLFHFREMPFHDRGAELQVCSVPVMKNDQE